VGASLGGIAALSELIGSLPGSFPAPIIAVQHGGGERLVELLARRAELDVRVASDEQPVPSSGVTVVPEGLAPTVCGDGLLRYERVGGGRRPVDRACQVLAGAFGPSLIGVVLTGKLDDGAQGVRAVKRAGGRVLVQDPTTAVAPGMPSAALATGCVDFVLPLKRLSCALVTLVMAPGAADLLVVAAPSWARY
jgi:two-component system chemotaxis response regulator CheB